MKLLLLMLTVSILLDTTKIDTNTLYKPKVKTSKIVTEHFEKLKGYSDENNKKLKELFLIIEEGSKDDTKN